MTCFATHEHIFLTFERDFKGTRLTYENDTKSSTFDDLPLIAEPYVLQTRHDFLNNMHMQLYNGVEFISINIWKTFETTISRIQFLVLIDYHYVNRNYRQFTWISRNDANAIKDNDMVFKCHNDHYVLGNVLCFKKDVCIQWVITELIQFCSLKQ